MAVFVLFLDIRQTAKDARRWALDALGCPPLPVAASPPAELPRESPSRVEDVYRSLAGGLEPQVKTQEVAIEHDRQTLTIRFLEKVLFRTGSAQITPQGKALLEKTGQALGALDREYIAVVGHADSLPIQTALFPSNWELSTARACSVVRFLSEKSTIAPERFYAIGRGECEPSFANDTQEGRAGNRRVDVVVSEMSCLRDRQPPRTGQPAQ